GESLPGTDGGADPGERGDDDELPGALPTAPPAGAGRGERLGELDADGSGRGGADQEQGLSGPASGGGPDGRGDRGREQHGIQCPRRSERPSGGGHRGGQAQG